MKSVELQKIVISKSQNGDGPTKIYKDLNGAVGLRTIERWCKLISESGTIELSTSSGRRRSVRTKKVVQKVKTRLKRKNGVTTRKLAQELGISRTTIRRILKTDLGHHPFKKIATPYLPNNHKIRRVKFANWVRHRYRKDETLRILFSDEKMFDINGVYNSQNDRIWAPNRDAANAKGGIKPLQKFPQKVMVWLGACSKGVTPLVILDNGTVNHTRYIKEVLPVALKYGNEVFGNNWTYQQDSARAHTHNLSQQWCKDNFPDFIPARRWPPNSPDLNPLDYSVWDELVHSMRWDNVKSKKTLIDELKRAVKRMRSEVILESCKNWLVRLRRVCKIKGDYYGK